MELLLNSHELLDLGSDLRGLRIQCTAGRCWVTQSGDSRDHILSKGGSLDITAAGRLIITADKPSRLAVVAGHWKLLSSPEVGRLRGMLRKCAAAIRLRKNVSV